MFSLVQKGNSCLGNTIQVLCLSQRCFLYRVPTNPWKYLNIFILNLRPWKYLKTGQVL